MATKPIITVVFLLVLGWPTVNLAAMEPLPKLRGGVPPHSVIGNVMTTNQQALGDVDPTAAGLALEEAPHLIWLADPDPRLRPAMVWDSQQGGIYSVRTLGNQLATAAAALDYGIHQLHAPILLITGNTDNDAIRLFQKEYGHLAEATRRALNHLHPALSHLQLADKEARDERAAAKQQLRAVEANVDYQVKRAMERYRQRVETGRLVVVGAVVDLANTYGTGAGRLLLINLNGETDPQQLKSSSHLVRVPPSMRDYLGRRSIP
ncbi:MAG: carbonic anhydrase [Desulfurivibrio sp.]|nr:carbonic anhydrase [Desulfurivibrio sp.]